MSYSSDIAKSQTRLQHDMEPGHREKSLISTDSEKSETRREMTQHTISTESDDNLELRASPSASKVVVVQPYSQTFCEDSCPNNDDPFSVVEDKEPFVVPKKVSFLTEDKQKEEDASASLDKLYLTPPAVVEPPPTGNEGAVMQLMRRLAGRFTKPHYDPPPGLSALEGKRFTYVRQLMDKDLNGRVSNSNSLQN